MDGMFIFLYMYDTFIFPKPGRLAAWLAVLGVRSAVRIKGWSPVAQILA
jgi:hypothetical protein